MISCAHNDNLQRPNTNMHIRNGGNMTAATEASRLLCKNTRCSASAAVVLHTTNMRILIMRGRTACVLPRCSCLLFSRDIILAPVVEMLKWLLCCFARTLHAHTRWVHVLNAGYRLRVSPLSVRTTTKRKRILLYLWCTAVFYHDHVSTW